MTLDPAYIQKVDEAYTRFSHLVTEGESGPTIRANDIRMTELNFGDPKDADYFDSVKLALDSVLDLADTTEAYRDHVRGMLSTLYGMGLLPEQILSFISSAGVRVGEDMGIFDPEKTEEIETTLHRHTLQADSMGLNAELLERWGKQIEAKYPRD